MAQFTATRRACLAVPLIAVGAACLGAAPAQARPTPAAQPDLCHSRYFIACADTPPPGGGNRGTPGWGRQAPPRPHWEGEWGGVPRNHGPFPPLRRTPRPGPS